MKLALNLGIRNHPKTSYALADLYGDYLDDVAYAETELGFENVWVNEHHLSSDHYAPSVFPILAAIAVRTSRIRIGPGVCLLPFHNPIRVSEDAATVDIISGGRLDLGIGIGSAPWNMRRSGRLARRHGNELGRPLN